MELSDEQKKKIEENRREALAKLAGSKRPLPTIEQNNDIISQSRPATSNNRVNNTKSKSKTDKKPTIKTRLESAGMVAVVMEGGGDALLFKGLSGSYYRDGYWHIPLICYRDFLARTKVDDGVPENILDILLSRNQKPDVFPLAGSIPKDLLTSLFPFQVDGVQWGLSKNGRCILADDMGLGKSLQALAIASYYRHEWPLLILAPASMVATWSEQVKKWYSPEWSDLNLTVVYDGKGILNGIVNIVSYDLAVRLIDHVETLSPGVIIADESHCLRNGSTKRVKTLKPILRKAGRLIMLSGTPALSRPIELFTQLSMVSPKLFPRQLDYGLRYCSGRKDRFGWNFRGASNLKELGVILEETIMLRRTKSEVLSQLPRKIRQQVFVRVPEKDHGELKALVETISVSEWTSLNGLEEAQRKGELMALWRKTGEAKLPAMWSYIQDLLDIEDQNEDSEEDTADLRKILLFAHHQNLMNELETRLINAKIGFVRIDGRTAPANRHSLCQQFQTDRKVRVAILSITAASVGLTLTAATLVVFCELFFNPGILVQAEDRAHRIGQTDCVTVNYLLARGTIDDRLWPLLLSKLNTLESVGLGENDFTNIAQVDHDSRQLKMDKFLTSS